MSWVIDQSHSAVNFSARHMMLSTVRGQFEKFSGTVDFNEQDPSKTAVDVKIESASINTKDEKRDGHLKSPDFLDVGNYPIIEFKSTRVETTGETTAKLHGSLTIKDVTKPVTLDVEFHGKAKSPWGTWSAGFTGTAKINREDWGLTWNVPLETGGWLVGKDIKIEIDVEVLQPQEQPAAEKAAA
jgi:polyisoprenoid-binding protein YceI